MERKTTEKRTSSEANINDIFDALQKLDSIDSLPTFVAKQLDRVPDRQPEEINLIAIVNRISQLEKRNKEYEEALSNHEIDLQYIKSVEVEHKIIEIKEKIKELEENRVVKSITVDDKNANNVSVNNDSDWESIIEDKDTPHSNQKSTVHQRVLSKLNRVYKKRTVPNRCSKRLIREKTKNINSDTSKKTQGNLIYSEKSNANNISLTDIETPQRIESRGQRKRHTTVTSPHARLIGARPLLSCIYVYSVAYGEKNDVIEFLRYRNISVDNIEVVSHPGSKFKSFKIQVTKNNINEPCSGDFWPEGMRCRLWKEKESKDDCKTPNAKRQEYFNSNFDKLNKDWGKYF